MTAEDSFHSQVELLSTGIRDISTRADELVAALAELRAECKGLAQLVRSGDESQIAYVAAALDTIASG